MIKRKIGEFTIFQSAKLNTFKQIEHFSSRDLGFERLQQLTVQLKLDRYSVVVPKQTHTDNIVFVTPENCSEVFYETDALMTNEKGIVLIVKTADCVPILLFDPKRSAIAVVHSGWRGTSKNIVGKTVQLMNEKFGSNPSDLIAAIGPCIGSKNYEVGSDVIDSFRSIFTDVTSFLDFISASPLKCKLDLKEVNKLLLIEKGLKHENIEISSLCTFDGEGNFYSARREGLKTGRMVNGIVLK